MGLRRLKTEEPGRIRRSVGGSEVAGGNCNSCDRPLFSRVRILYEDGSLKGDRFLSLPADQRQGDDEHNGDKKSDPSFDFVGTSHLNIINFNIVYMMIAGSGAFFAGAATGHPSPASFTDVVNPEIIVLMLRHYDYMPLYSVLFQAFTIDGNATV